MLTSHISHGYSRFCRSNVLKTPPPFLKGNAHTNDWHRIKKSNTHFVQSDPITEIQPSLQQYPLSPTSFAPSASSSSSSSTISTSASESLVSTSSFENVDNCLYDTIFPSTSVSTHSFNNTFAYIRSGEKGRDKQNERQVWTDPQTLFYGQNSFTSDVFQGISSSRSGGALYVSGVTTEIICKQCTFLRCSSTSGMAGACYCSSCISQFTQTNFTQCTASAYGGALYMNYGTQIIQQCFFDSCQSESSGAGLYTNSRDPPITLSDSTFLGCTAQSGAAACLNLNTRYLFSSCLFALCTTSSSSSAILHVNENGTTGRVALSFCFFANNTHSTSSLPNDVYFSRTFNTPVPSPITASFSVSELPHVGVNQSTPSEVADWLPFPTYQTIFVASSVPALEYFSLSTRCGIPLWECTTIKRGTERSLKEHNAPIVVSAGRYVETQMAIGQNSINIRSEEGAGREEVIVKTDSGKDVFCLISTGSLSLTSFTIQHSSTSSGGSSFLQITSSGSAFLLDCVVTSEENPVVELTHPLLDLRGGNLLLDGVEVRGMKMRGCSVISFGLNVLKVEVESSSIIFIQQEGEGGGICGRIGGEGKSVSVWNSTMNSTSNKGGNGGGMRIEMRSGSCLRIGNATAGDMTKITNCYASGNGGGLWVKCESGATDFVIAKSSFSRCSARGFGDHLFVEAVSLKAVVTNNSFKFNPDLTSTTRLMGFEGGDTSFAIPLVLYFQECPLPIHVGGVGATVRDFDACGFSTYPCQTIDHAFQLHFNNAKDCSIQLDAATSLNKQMSLSRTSSFSSSSQSEKRSITVSPPTSSTSGSGMIQVSASASFTRCIFTTAASFASSSVNVFVCSSNTLSLSECSFAGPGGSWNVQASLVVVEGGSLSCSNLGVVGVTMSSGSVVEIRRMGTNGKCAMVNTTLQSVVRRGGDGSVSSGVLKTGEEAEVVGGDFLSCRCEGGNGGGMRMEMASGSRLRIGNSTAAETNITNCQASGNGGGVNLVCGKGATDFVVAQLSFSGCTASGYGQHLFLEAPSLKSVVTTNAFNFSPNLSSRTELMGFDGGDTSFAIPLVLYLQDCPLPLHVGGEGEHSKDFEVCGFEGYPCSTISFALQERFKDEEGFSIVLDSSSSILQEISLHKQTTVTSPLGSEKMRITIQDERASTTHQKGFIQVENTTQTTRCLFLIPSTFQSERTTVFEVNSAAVLHMDTCGLASREQGKAIPVSFIRITSGSTELSLFCVEGSVTFGSVSLIEMKESSGSSTTALTMVNSTLGGVTHTSGNGSVAQGIVGEGDMVSVVGGKMDGCKSQGGGNGGGMSLHMREWSSVRIGNETIGGQETEIINCVATGNGGRVNLLCGSGATNFVISKISFEGCQATGFGQHIFLEASSLLTVVTNDSFNFSPDLSVRVQLMGFEQEDFSFPIPLVFYLQDCPLPVRVGGSNSRDFDVCGFEGYPCTTIDHAFSVQFNNERECQIQLDYATAITHPLTLSNVSSFFSSSLTLRRTVEIVDSDSGTGQEGFVEIRATTTFTRGAFILPSTVQPSRHSLFLVRSDKFSLEDSSVQTKADQEGTLPVPFLCLDGGSLDLDSFSTPGPLLMGSCSLIVLKETNTEGVAVEVKNSSFVGVRKNEGDGSVLSGVLNEGQMMINLQEPINGKEMQPILLSLLLRESH